MTWRLAHSLEVLRNEINQRYPQRSRVSDGTIGDAAHQSQGSASDHNPWLHDPSGVGVVRAFDITADPQINPVGLAEALRLLGKTGDARLAEGGGGYGYVIFQGRICDAIQGWAWRAYSGDPHNSHIHLSVTRNYPGYDNGAAWNLYAPLPQPQPPPEDDDMKPIIYTTDGYPGVFVTGDGVTCRIANDNIHAHGANEGLFPKKADGSPADPVHFAQEYHEWMRNNTAGQNIPS